MPGLLDIGASFDWISPLAAFLEGLLGSYYTFLISFPFQYSPRELSLALKKKGIGIGTMYVAGGTLSMNVTRKTAGSAQFWMKQWDVPIQNPMSKRKRQRKPRRRTRKRKVRRKRRHKK